MLVRPDELTLPREPGHQLTEERARLQQWWRSAVAETDDLGQSGPEASTSSAGIIGFVHAT